MALTPAQRHRARVLAEKTHAASPYGIEVQGSAYELMLVKLATDKRTLKSMESVKLKREAKARLLPDYLPWIEGTLATGQGGKDVVLATVMVWAIDAGAYGLGLRMASYVLQHSLPLPDLYQRSAAALVMDEFSDAYLRGQWNPLKPVTDASGNTVLVPDDTHPAEHLTGAAGITEGKDAPDQARAKLCKATAYALLGKVQTAEEAQLDQLPRDTIAGAHALLEQALHLDAMSGVKKDIERITRKQRLLLKAQEQQAAADVAAATDAPQEPPAQTPQAVETQPKAAPAPKPAARKKVTRTAPAKTTGKAQR